MEPRDYRVDLTPIFFTLIMSNYENINHTSQRFPPHEHGCPRIGHDHRERKTGMSTPEIHQWTNGGGRVFIVKIVGKDGKTRNGECLIIGMIGWHGSCE
jgi:hypothetical protein